jgi:hypothetical protein
VSLYVGGLKGIFVRQMFGKKFQRKHWKKKKKQQNIKEKNTDLKYLGKKIRKGGTENYKF